MNPVIAIDKDLKVKINEEQKNKKDESNMNNPIENNENVTNNSIATSAVIHFSQLPTLVSS